MTDKILTDHYEKKKTVEWDCPEHYIPIVPKTYKVTTLGHKQNEPVKTVEIKERG